MEVGHIILKGNNKVMFSAPHAVEQTRDGKIKFAEKETGDIAKELNKMGFSCIIKTKNVGDDANYDLNSAYKNDLLNFIKQNKIEALIDLHQLSPMREQMICIGAGGDEYLNLQGSYNKAKTIQQHFAKFFKNVTINEPFAAKGEGTIARYVSKNCNIPCVQIEINSQLFLQNGVSIEDMAKIFNELACIMGDFNNEKNLVD